MMTPKEYNVSRWTINYLRCLEEIVETAQAKATLKKLADWLEEQHHKKNEREPFMKKEKLQTRGEGGE